jgi:hypothetical protein
MAVDLPPSDREDWKWVASGLFPHFHGQLGSSSSLRPIHIFDEQWSGTPNDGSADHRETENWDR